MFSVKEVARNLQISTQAIYKQKEELISKGYMVKNDSNQWEITDNGFNYLQDKKINFVQQHAIGNIQPVVNQVENKQVEAEEEKPKNIDFTSNDTVVNLLIEQYKTQLQTLTNQLKEVQEQKEYFKAKFEEKDNLLNQYINTHLLPPTELQQDNRQDQPTKKTFLQRLFNK